MGVMKDIMFDEWEKENWVDNIRASIDEWDTEITDEARDAYDSGFVLVYDEQELR